MKTAKMFGIPNCGSVKKAKVWLEENKVEIDFHDYKKQGIDLEHLKKWCKEFGWEKVLNRKGTTWRNLDDGIKLQVIDEDSAIELMLNHNSTIKRPVIETAKGNVIGFDESIYNQTLK
jgi:arsenate reductase